MRECTGDLCAAKRPGIDKPVFRWKAIGTLLGDETEQYFGLDETGTRMWQLVTGSPNIDAAYQELLAEFDVEPELLRSNLTELLSRLVDSGLLQVLPADVGTAPAI